MKLLTGINVFTPNTDNMLMSRVYEDLDIDRDMRLTISKFVEIDWNAEIAEDASDNMILNAIQPQTYDTDSNVTSVDEDSDSEKVQPPCKTVIDCLSIVIKFLEMESSTTEADISKHIIQTEGWENTGRTYQTGLLVGFYSETLKFSLT